MTVDVRRGVRGEEDGRADQLVGPAPAPQRDAAAHLCRLGGAYTATFVLELPLVWLWLALLPDYVARCLLKGWRFNSGRWKAIKV